MTWGFDRTTIYLTVLREADFSLKETRVFKIGRYWVSVGRYCQMQTKVPVVARHFLFFWFLKEANPNDIDKNQQFPLGTPMEYEGRKYYYYKAGADINTKEIL